VIERRQPAGDPEAMDAIREKHKPSPRASAT